MPKYNFKKACFDRYCVTKACLLLGYYLNGKWQCPFKSYSIQKISRHAQLELNMVASDYETAQ